MRVLVTGGCGFVGQHTVQAYVDGGHEVFVLDALTRAATGRDRVLEIIGEERLIGGRVEEPLQVAAAMRKATPDLVLHLAAESHVDESLERPAHAMHVNAVGTMVVAMACAKADTPLVYCSTDEVYGDLFGTRWSAGAHEGAPLAPSSPYSAGKAAGEHAVHAVARSFGLRAVITRACNAFGPGQLGEKLVPIACRLLQQGKQVPIHGEGEQVRQWIHVEEFAEGLLLAGRRAQGLCREDSVQAFNLAGPDRMSVRALVDRLARVAGTEGPPCLFGADRPGQDRLYALDGTRAEAGLGFRPKRHITDAHELQALLDCYQGDDVRLAAFVAEG